MDSAMAEAIRARLLSAIALSIPLNGFKVWMVRRAWRLVRDKAFNSIEWILALRGPLHYQYALFFQFH